MDGLIVLSVQAAVAALGVGLGARVSLQRWLSRRFGVAVRLGWIVPGLMRPGLSFRHVEIANPEGFSAAPLLRLGSARLELTRGRIDGAASLLVRVRLRDLNALLETGTGGSNWSVLIGRARLPAEPAATADPVSRRSPLVRLEQICVEGLQGRLRLVPASAGMLAETAARIGEIEVAVERLVLEPQGTAERQAVQLGQALAIVLSAVGRALVEHATALPRSLARDLFGAGGSFGGATFRARWNSAGE